MKTTKNQFRSRFTANSLKTRFKTIIAILCFGATAFGQSSYSLFNDPTDENERYTILNDVVTLIDNTPANGEIRAGLYSFTYNPVRDALIRAADRGVMIKIAIDKYGTHSYDNSCIWGETDSNQCTNYKDVTALEDTFVYYPKARLVRCMSKDGQACISNKQGIQHEKYFLFSETSNPNRNLSSMKDVVFVTSSNMTYSGGRSQYNDAMVMYGDDYWYTHWVDNHTKQFNQEKESNYYRPTKVGYFQSPNTYWTAFFSPNGDGQHDIWQRRLREGRMPGEGASQSSESYLYLNHASFNDSRIVVADELVRLKKLGTDVRVLVSSIGSKVRKKLEDAGIPIRVVSIEYQSSSTKKRTAHTHHKYMIYSGVYDGNSGKKRVWLGCHNLTKAANYNNDEVIVKVGQSASHSAYKANFLSMWEVAAP